MIAIDTETFLIGPEDIAPMMICCTYSRYEEDGSITNHIFSHVDDAENRLRELFESGEDLVLHNAAFDLSVIIRSYPNLLDVVWKALDERRIHDTKIRERLLRLSSTGDLTYDNLPDGSRQKVQYSLAALVMRHLQIDISSDKQGDDIWRLNYHTLQGLPASEYPADAAEYAMMDAEYTLRVFLCQEAMKEADEGAPCSVGTSTFQTAVDFALFQVTIRGMATDKHRFHRLQQEMEEETSEERLAAGIDAGIYKRSVPPLPYVNKKKLLAELSNEWLEQDPEFIDWRLVDPGLRQAFIDAGVPFKKPEEIKCNAKELKRRVLALQVAEQAPYIGEVDDILKFNPDLESLSELAEEADVVYKTTKTGDVSTDKDIIADLADKDVVWPTHDVSPLKCYERRQKVRQIVSTELPRMMWGDHLAPVVHPNFDILKETGRTSSFSGSLFPSFNGQNVDPRARGCFKARDGHVLVSTDYSAMELFCCGQQMYSLFGWSVHRDRINEGYDLHAYLGSKLCYYFDNDFHASFEGAHPGEEELYRQFLILKKTDNKKFKFYRKFAKPVGLGFASGLGPMTMIRHASNHPYNIDVAAIAMERYERGADEFRDPAPIVMFYAKRLFKMDAESFEWHPKLITLALTNLLREIWYQTYPEMIDYAKWIKEQKDDRNTIMQRDYDSDDPDAKKESSALFYVSPLGMYRAGASYTEAINGFALQTPGAEGAKYAVLNFVREQMIGKLKGRAFLVDFIHDELLYEVVDNNIDERQAIIEDAEQIMIDGMREVITDVSVGVESAMMINWSKYAEPIFDDQNRLVPCPTA